MVGWAWVLWRGRKGNEWEWRGSWLGFWEKGGGGEGVHVGSFYEKTVAIELAPECVCLFFFFFFFWQSFGWMGPTCCSSL